MPIESLDFLVVRHASTLSPSLYLPALIENIWLAVTRRKIFQWLCGDASDLSNMSHALKQVLSLDCSLI
jgi:hypothetical protein